jgi:hypothetical protein
VTKANATTRAVIAEIQRTGAGTLKAIAQELEARGVRTPAGRDRWAPKPWRPKPWSPLGGYLTIPIARRECRRRSMIWTYQRH